MRENDRTSAAPDLHQTGVVTITTERHRSLSDHQRGSIYFHPPPSEAGLPQVWLDLHAADASYQVCGQDRDLHPKPQGEDKIIVIPGRASVRIRTVEAVGTDRQHIAILSNIRSLAFGGLLMAPGKIDTGFPPRQLYLVIHNSTSRAQAVKVGQKVAAIAFLTTTLPSGAVDPKDVVPNDYVRYAPTRLNRLKGFWEAQLAPNLGVFILRLVARLVVIGLAAYIGGKVVLWNLPS
jgi:hypothetical protein